MEEAFSYFNLCTVCGTCRADCTIYKIKKLESLSPRSRIILAGLLAQNRIDISPRVIEAYFTCTLCDMCHNKCPSGVDVPKIVKIIRNYLIQNKKAPKPITDLLNVIKNSKNIFNIDNEDRLAWTEEIEEIINDKINKSAKIAFYIGCQGSFKGSIFPMPVSMVKILNKLKIDFTILGEEEWCCGNPIALTGNLGDDFIQFAKHNIDKMNELGVEKILFTCPGCYRTWKFIYPQALKIKKLPFELIHSTEFIDDLIKQGKLNIENKYSKRIGYQDPCELGRMSGIFDPPRNILKSIPDIQFIELEDSRMNSACCGGGGLCKVTYNFLSEEIAKYKINMFKNSNVETIITSCPACFDNLSSVIDDNIEIKDIHELILDLL